MKKTLLAAALAVGFAGVAQAETSVTLYGIIDTGISYERDKGIIDGVDSNGDFTRTKATRTGIYDGHNTGQAGSRWGLKGTEDLGNGLRAEFMLESGFNVTHGGSMQGGRLFGRQAWVGLAGDNWGSLRFGRQHNVGTDYMLGMVDPFGGGFGLANGGEAFRAINTNRMDNTIRYDTPNFSGFQFGVAYSFNHDGEQLYKFSGEDDANNRAVSAAIRYANGPIGVALTYDQMKNSSHVGYQDVTLRQWNLGASYDFEVVKVSAAFGQTRNGEFGGGRGLWTIGPVVTPYTYTVAPYDDGAKSNSYLVGLSAPVGAGTVMASWTMVDPRGKSDRIRDLEDALGESIDFKKQHTYALGYKYPLSKRTDVYAYGAYKKNVDFVRHQKSTTVAAGITHRF